MSLSCPCGVQTHYDADFTYYVRCSGCAQVYMANGHIEMVPLTTAEVETLRDGEVVEGV